MAFPGTYNFSYYRGDTYEFIIYPKNSLGGSYDLEAGHTAEFNIATARGGAVVATVAWASGGASGATTFTIASANSAIEIGQQVTGTNIPANTRVTNISGTTVSLSSATTGQVSGDIKFAKSYHGTATIDTGSNYITCTIPATIGRFLVGGTSYVYDVQITLSGVVTTILNGTITVTNDISGAV